LQGAKSDERKLLYEIYLAESDFACSNSCSLATHMYCKYWEADNPCLLALLGLLMHLAPDDPGHGR